MQTAKLLPRRFTIVALIILCVVVVVVGLRLLIGFGFTFNSSFKKIRTGMSETEVVAALGAANERSTQFRLGQHEGFEKEYARAADSGSAYYLSWNKGIDVVYTVGFDKDGRVTMKAFGGT